MIDMIGLRHRLLSGLVGKLVRDFTSSLKPQLFQTAVGVKYRAAGFDSNHFSEYVIHDVPFVSAGISFSDLLMPPDLLRNRFTICGRSVLQSPHYLLIEDIVSETLTLDSEYLARCRMGTLDARLPADLPIEFLMNKYQLQRVELDRGEMATVFVVKTNLKNRTAYIIVDGKHRAALVAVCQRPESLLLRVISNKFARTPFFHKVYSYMQRMNPAEYSINQEMIKDLQNESQIT